MNRGHEVGCPALRGGVPCACWLPPSRAQRDSQGDVTHILGHSLRFWLDVKQEIETRGYDRLLDGFMERIARLGLELDACKAGREADRRYRLTGIENLHARIVHLEEQNRALDIEWHGLQRLCGDQRETIIELAEAIDLTGQASPWD